VAGLRSLLLGGFLAALLLGPAPAVLVMATIFVVQCLLFQDGGVTALGANLFNMGIIGSLGGYGLYRLLRRLPSGEGTAVAAAAWASVMVGAAEALLGDDALLETHGLEVLHSLRPHPGAPHHRRLRPPALASDSSPPEPLHSRQR
jgi:hypothetical protein